jgi:hypothetical protein
MAKYTPKPTSPPKPKTFKPGDYLKGSTTVGQNYTAWDTFGQGKPDFGKDLGPGDPYHEVLKKNSGFNPPQRGVGGVDNPVTGPGMGQPIKLGNVFGQPQRNGTQPTSNGGSRSPLVNNLLQHSLNNTSDPRIAAIRKRLGWS